MRHASARHERATVNRLTAAKMALQILQRRTALSDEQQRLVRTALEATDGLALELLRASVPAGAAGRAAAGRSPAAPPAVPSAGKLLRSLAWFVLRGGGGLARQALFGRSTALRAQGPGWRELRPRPRRDWGRRD